MNLKACLRNIHKHFVYWYYEHRMLNRKYYFLIEIILCANYLMNSYTKSYRGGIWESTRSCSLASLHCKRSTYNYFYSSHTIIDSKIIPMMVKLPVSSSDVKDCWRITIHPNRETSRVVVLSVLKLLLQYTITNIVLHVSTIIMRNLNSWFWIMK